MDGRRGTVVVVGTALLAGVLWGAEARGQEAGDDGAAPPGPSLRFVTDPRGVNGVNLTVYFRAEPEAVWEVVTNPVKAASLFDRMTAIKASSRGPAFREYHMNSILGDKLVVCAIEQDEGRRHLSWKRVDGHLSDMHGYYRVAAAKQHPGWSRMDYASFIDPGAVGRALMTNRGRQRDVMAMIARIRRYVENG